jgi:arabinofuranosyltransferase
MQRSGLFASITILLVAFLSVAGYVLWANSQGLAGFPLDDAWIHQTYARNLAETGQLAYLPGQPSAGSTSPAWSFLLSIGYLLGLDFRVWAYLLGALSLAATAWLAYRLLLRLPPLRQLSGQSSRPAAALLAGLFCAVEWHLVWAAASGMETILFTALSLALVEYFSSQVAMRQSPEGPASVQKEQAIVSALGIGLLGGVLVLTRPEGLVLAGMVILGLVIFPRPADRSQLLNRLLAAGLSLLALAGVLAPYLAFNLRASGAIFPNTFYAKQVEYLSDWTLPERFWTVLSPTLVGAQILLLPGFGYAAYLLIRRREWPAVLPLVWWLAILSVYALRLPVNYQHGRYVIPTIPWLIIYGTWGTAMALRDGSPSLIVRVVSRGTPVAIALLAVLFWGRGALAYNDDVAFIEGEMMVMARWLDENTPPDTIIAVHDIGAVGYITDRPLLDLAGLITPEVIPIMTDAEKLADWMIERGAEYAIFFPDFSPTYEQLDADTRLEQVHCTAHAWTRAAGLKNMCAYLLTGGAQP